MAEVREAVRPVLADVGETAQFLSPSRSRSHTKPAICSLTSYDDLAAALKRLLRFTEGDYGPDKYAERFPKAIEGTDRASRLGSYSRSG